MIKYPYILRDYTHARDIAGGLAALLLGDFCGAVNIGSGTPVALCAIAEKVALLIGCPVPKCEIRSTDGSPPLVAVDTRSLNDVVGFRLNISWEEGLTEIIEWREECFV